MKTLLVILLLAVLVENVFDVISTTLILSKGRGSEANPIVRFAMQYLGKFWWLTKLPVLLALYAMYNISNVGLATAFAAAFFLLYAYVLYNNYSILWRKV